MSSLRTGNAFLITTHPTLYFSSIYLFSASDIGILTFQPPLVPGPLPISVSQWHLRIPSSWSEPSSWSVALGKSCWWYCHCSSGIQLSFVSPPPISLIVLKWWSWVIAASIASLSVTFANIHRRILFKYTQINLPNHTWSQLPQSPSYPWLLSSTRPDRSCQALPLHCTVPGL